MDGAHSDIGHKDGLKMRTLSLLIQFKFKLVSYSSFCHEEIWHIRLTKIMKWINLCSHRHENINTGLKHKQYKQEFKRHLQQDDAFTYKFLFGHQHSFNYIKAQNGSKKQEDLPKRKRKHQSRKGLNKLSDSVRWWVGLVKECKWKIIKRKPDAPFMGRKSFLENLFFFQWLSTFLIY